MRMVQAVIRQRGVVGGRSVNRRGVVDVARLGRGFVDGVGSVVDGLGSMVDGFGSIGRSGRSVGWRGSRRVDRGTEHKESFSNQVL